MQAYHAVLLQAHYAVCIQAYCAMTRFHRPSQPVTGPRRSEVQTRTPRRWHPTPPYLPPAFVLPVQRLRPGCDLIFPLSLIAPLSGCPQQPWDSDRARREVNGQPAPRFRVSRVTSRLFRPFLSIPMLRTTRQKRSYTMEHDSINPDWRSAISRRIGEVTDEDAYMAAGRRVVDLSDVMIAVWIAKPAKGKGGTADIG